MKTQKIIVCILTAAAAICFCSCGSNSSPKANESDKITSSIVSYETETVDTACTVNSSIVSSRADEKINKKQAPKSTKEKNVSLSFSVNESSDVSSINESLTGSNSDNGNDLIENSIVIETETENETENSINDISSAKENPAVKKTTDKKLIVIDAGHQQNANLEQEPIGPGSLEMKMKVSGGTAGKASGKAEYELTLELALKLQSELEQRGYEVIQVRTTHDVDISNSQRSEIANNAGADAFIRIHANGSEDTSKQGAMTICQTQSNPYNGDLFAESKALSEYVLDELAASTGCVKEYVWETDTMSGINWSEVPVTIVEVGYMSNPQEDMMLSDENYQNKIALGIANGIDDYFDWRLEE